MPVLIFSDKTIKMFLFRGGLCDTLCVAKRMEMTMGNEKKDVRNVHRVDGFAFEGDSDAAKAQKEAQGVAYIRAKIDINDPANALLMYNKIVDQGLFETAVGYAYLKELQEALLRIDTISDKDIHPIRVKHEAAQADYKNEKTASPQAKDAAVSGGSTRKKAEKSDNMYLAGAHDVPDNGKHRREICVNYKIRFRLAAFLCVIFGACVVGMFAITSTTNNATVLNYETEIINKYEDWDAQLTERENAVKAREEELGL
jgi:hypothetical protein